MASRANSWRSYRPGTRVTGAALVAVPRRETVRVLGLDPGSQTTGFGVVESGPQGTKYLASGAIRARAGTGAEAFAKRLQDIYAGVAAVVAEHRPTEIAVERVFVHRNPDSALKLGQARGAALCATFASGAQLHEYTPREVKLAIVGFGAAEKEQVQRMVKALLGLEGRLGADAADALAIALCHAHGRGARLAIETRAAGGAR